MGNRNDKKVSPKKKAFSGSEFIELMQNEPTMEVYAYTTKEGNTYTSLITNDSLVVLDVGYPIDVLINDARQGESQFGIAFPVSKALPADMYKALIKFSTLKSQAVSNYLTTVLKQPGFTTYPMIKTHIFTKVRGSDG